VISRWSALLLVLVSVPLEIAAALALRVVKMLLSSAGVLVVDGRASPSPRR